VTDGLHHLMATRQDYRDRAGLQAASRDWRRAAKNSRPNAVEERDILLRLDKARYSLILRAMLSGDFGRCVDRAGVADLGRIRITLEQERLRPRAGGSQRPEE
jgi:hypothetical protein